MFRIKTLILVFLFALSAWALGLAYYAASSVLLKPEEIETKTDAIVVLTGGDNRVETGLALFVVGLAPNLYITGVHPDVTKEEILQMWKGGAIFPSCCVEIGHAAESTQQNATETRDWLKGKNFSSLRLVTSNYHMHRAMLEFRNALPGTKIIRHPIIQPDIKPSDEYFWRVIMIEYHKTLFRCLGIARDAFIGALTDQLS